MKKKKKLSKQITLMNKYHNIRRKKKKESEDQKDGGIKWKMEIQSSRRKQEQFTTEMKRNVEDVQMKRPC